MTTAQAQGFAAYETFTGRPLPAEPIAALRTLRAEVEQEIERLLAFLDATDGDPDIEANGDEQDEDRDEEPSLGWIASGPSAVDRSHEHDIDVEVDDSDQEPALASPEGASCPVHGIGVYEFTSLPRSQAGWARGNSRDLEGDAQEDDEDSDTGLADSDALAEMRGDEPSLGASEAINQDEAWRLTSDEWLGPDRERCPRRLAILAGRVSVESNVRMLDGRPFVPFVRP